MRIGAIPEGPLDRLALALDLVTLPILDTLPALLQARALIVATRHGVFDALADGPSDVAGLAGRCGLSERGLRPLLEALVGCRYLERAPPEAYRLSAVARRWMPSAAPRSLHDSTVYRQLEWDWVASLDQFVASGEPLRIHATMTPADWALYQPGMADLARMLAPELVPLVPVPRGARRLLDVGGAHGRLAVEVCRRHPGLAAEVLDLPAAIDAAAPLLAAASAETGVGERVRHRAGDVLTVDLGSGSYDVILVSQLLHHLDAAAVADLVARCARALTPGGVLVLVEMLRPAGPRRSRAVAGEQIASLIGLYFSLTSESGLWSAAELEAWVRAAALVPRRLRRLRSAPGVGVLAATRS